MTAPHAITSTIHINTSHDSSKPAPASPLDTSAALAPDSELTVPLAETGTGTGTAPEHLDALADAMDETRTHLNSVLTSWKDWAGKELDSTTGLYADGKGGIRKDYVRKGDDEDMDEDEDEEEQDEDEDEQE